MKAEIRDLDALSRLSLVDVRAYLTSQDWAESGKYGDVATIFSKNDDSGRHFEVLLPTRPEFRDYPQRMSELITVVSTVEGRDPIPLYYDLIKSGFDVIRFRALSADGAGTIGLENGVALYDHAQHLIAAVANAAVKPKRAYRGSIPEQAKTYMNELRLGQTEVGSYVLTVLSPVPPALEPDQKPLFDFGPLEDPFQRIVTRKMVRALSATKGAVSSATVSGKLEPFEDSVDSGVSANLCDAIAKLVDEGGGVDISVSWSRVRPAPEPMKVFSFTEDNARVLTEAAVAFRDREPLTDVTIEGFVIGLYRKHDQFDGQAKIRGFVDGQVKTMTAQFIYPDYNKVVLAHERKQRIRVDGDLIKRGITYLDNARNLVVMDDDEAGP